MKKLFFGVIAVAMFSTSVFAAEKSHTVELKTSTENIINLEKAIGINNTDTTQKAEALAGCFPYTMVSDCGSFGGTWCGSLGSFLKIAKAFLEASDEC